MRMKLLSPALLAIVAVMAVASVTVVLADSGPQRAPSGRLAALEAPQASSDRLPSELADYPVAERLDAASSRHLATVDGKEFFIVRGTSQTTCLIYTSGSNTTFQTAGTCGATGALMSDGIYFREYNSDGEGLTAVVVPDGYTTAMTEDATVEVSNNLVVFTGPVPKTVRLSGNGYKPTEYDLGHIGSGPTS